MDEPKNYYREYLALQKTLRRIRYMLCLNIVEDMTHRARDKHLTSVVREIGVCLDNAFIYEDLDEIPF